MNPIEYIGNYLAELTGKDRNICRGLIRIALKQQYPHLQPFRYDFDHFYKTTDITLREMLKSIFPLNSDQIVSQILTRLTEIQSLFTLA